MTLGLRFVLSDSSQGLAGQQELEIDVGSRGIVAVFINGHDFTSPEMLRAVDMLVGKTARELLERHRAGKRDDCALAKRQVEDKMLEGA